MFKILENLTNSVLVHVSFERLMCEVEFWEVCVRGRYDGVFNVFPHATASLPDS